MNPQTIIFLLLYITIFLGELGAELCIMQKHTHTHTHINCIHVCALIWLCLFVNRCSGIDLLSYEPDLNTLRLVEAKRFSVSWYVYTHESRMVLLASGMQCTIFSGYQVTTKLALDLNMNIQIDMWKYMVFALALSVFFIRFLLLTKVNMLRQLFLIVVVLSY